MLTLLSTEAMQESDKLPASDFEAATDIIRKGESFLVLLMFDLISIFYYTEIILVLISCSSFIFVGNQSHGFPYIFITSSIA